MSQKLCPGETGPPRVKNKNRFCIGAPVEETTTIRQTLLQEMAVYELESMTDFDKFIEFDPMTVEKGFQPISKLSMKFWSDLTIKVKYPMMSTVALNVRLILIDFQLISVDSP